MLKGTSEAWRSNASREKLDRIFGCQSEVGEVPFTPSGRRKMAKVPERQRLSEWAPDAVENVR